MTDSPPDAVYRVHSRTCKRDTCENETNTGKRYCSRKCWKADNPEVSSP